MTDTFFKDFYLPKKALFRAIVTKLFPGADRCLYLDADIIADGDIGEFYSLDFNGADLAACPDMGARLMITNTSTLLEDHRGRYFNSGVLLWNLSKLRGRDLLGECKKALDSVTDLWWADQDMLNIIFRDSCRLMDWRAFNFQTGYVKYSGSGKHCFYHYNGKPWKMDGYTCYKDLYWQYALPIFGESAYRKWRLGYAVHAVTIMPLRFALLTAKLSLRRRLGRERYEVLKILLKGSARPS